MKRVLVLLGTIVIVTVGTVGVASATPTGKTDAAVLGNVQIDPSDPTVGYVTARYICNGGLTASTHLWVSVKQTADRSPDNALKGEASSRASAAWSQSHPTAEISCDGQWHVQTFTIGQTDYGFGTLQQGQGYVQFCLFGGDNVYAASQRFVEVE
ncbi:MAG: hypothetical protein ACJ76I_16750 [Gaiellaceae bacterium]